MGKRKNEYIPSPFESAKGKGDTSANIYMSMLCSEAFSAINIRQKMLYVYCKAQMYSEKKGTINGLNEIEPDKDKQKPYFTMNWWKVNTFFGIYTNQNTFRDDMNKLIEVGLIDCVSCGASSRTKSIYKLSDRWQKFGTADYQLPESVKTFSLSRKEKKQT